MPTKGLQLITFAAKLETLGMNAKRIFQARKTVNGDSSGPQLSVKGTKEAMKRARKVDEVDPNTTDTYDRKALKSRSKMLSTMTKKYREVRNITVRLEKIIEGKVYGVGDIIDFRFIYYLILFSENK